MVIALFGNNGVGKSGIAKKLAEALDAQIYTGKDYLRLAKNESEAEAVFRELLAKTDGAVIYVISESRHLALLPEQAVRVLVTAPLDTIKTRFAARMGGQLPIPVAQMLERRFGMFDTQRYDVHISENNASEACTLILSAARGK